MNKNTSKKLVKIPYWAKPDFIILGRDGWNDSASADR